jgi:hypothetical protein
MPRSVSRCHAKLQGDNHNHHQNVPSLLDNVNSFIVFLLFPFSGKWRGCSQSTPKSIRLGPSSRQCFPWSVSVRETILAPWPSMAGLVSGVEWMPLGPLISLMAQSGLAGRGPGRLGRCRAATTSQPHQPTWPVCGTRIYRLTIVTEASGSASRVAGLQSRYFEQVPLTYVFIGQFMREPYTLRLVLDRLAVDDSSLELFNNTSMDSITLAVVHAR